MGQLALASSMTVIGSDEGRAWHPRRKNDGGLGGCTCAAWCMCREMELTGEGAREVGRKGTLGMVIPLDAG